MAPSSAAGKERRPPKDSRVRTMFAIYVVLIVVGVVFYSVVGLADL
jgi:hypothetical protein